MTDGLFIRGLGAIGIEYADPHSLLRELVGGLRRQLRTHTGTDDGASRPSGSAPVRCSRAASLDDSNLPLYWYTILHHMTCKVLPPGQSGIECSIRNIHS